MLKFLQTESRFQVLALNLNNVKFYEGTQHDLFEIGLAEDMLKPTEDIDINTEKFFRSVDRDIMSNHTKDSKISLILATLPEHESLFKSLSHNKQLEDEFISCNPEVISLEDLQKQAWKILEPKFQLRISTLIEDYSNAKANDYGSDDIHQIAKAAAEGQVEHLIIEAKRQIGGQLNPIDGKIKLNDLSDPNTDDVLDDLAQMVLKMGGQVLVLPKEKMPTKSGAAAIYRFKSVIAEVIDLEDESDLETEIKPVLNKAQMQKDKSRATNEGVISPN